MRAMGCGNVAVMRQRASGAWEKGCGTEGARGNVRAVRGMRAGGNASACRRSREDMRAQQREGERESMGRFCFCREVTDRGRAGDRNARFFGRVMLRHATGMFHVKHSQNGEQWKALVRGGRGGVASRAAGCAGKAGTLRLRAVGCACAYGVWLFGREGACEGARMGVAHACTRLGCLSGPCAQTYGPLERRGGVLECVAAQEGECGHGDGVRPMRRTPRRFYRRCAERVDVGHEQEPRRFVPIL